MAGVEARLKLGKWRGDVVLNARLPRFKLASAATVILFGIALTRELRGTEVIMLPDSTSQKVLLISIVFFTF